MNTKIIAGFPGVGKSFVVEQFKDNITMVDSDSSEFHYYIDYSDGNAGTKRTNPEWPSNYINYIKSMIGKVEYIFVSSHKEIRDALNIPFTLVIPMKECKEEYVGRYFLRGNPTEFINKIASNWDSWIDDIYNEYIGSDKIILLQRGCHLLDYLKATDERFKHYPDTADISIIKKKFKAETEDGTEYIFSAGVPKDKSLTLSELFALAINSPDVPIEAIDELDYVSELSE